MKLLLFLLAAAAAASPAPANKVLFKTSDGWTLAAYYRPPRAGGVVLILVHGVGSSKGEWDAFAERLDAEGVGTFALDLRGHLGSRRGPTGRRGYEDFDAAGEWPKAAEDLRAAASWLAGKKIPATRIAYGGASIGANLAAQASARAKEAPFQLLLSPGPDYRGVGLTIRPGLKTLVAASAADGYAHQTLKPLSAVEGVEPLEAPAGHGAQMFADKATLDRIVAWVVRASRPEPGR